MPIYQRVPITSILSFNLDNYKIRLKRLKMHKVKSITEIAIVQRHAKSNRIRKIFDDAVLG